jgi:spore coat polysaccharide biosynthesis protein SpsF
MRKRLFTILYWRNNLNIGVIIQARTGSKRLPGKVLKKIGDKNLLEHILHRLNKLQHSSKTVIATSILEKDDVIEDFCLDKNVSCYRGSEENVLQRYYLCSKENEFSHIVRLTGDNPFIDVGELDNLINLHIDTESDYSRSFSVLPKGVGCEIFTFEALELSYRYGNEDNHKEHVNEYIEENEINFKISELNVDNKKKKPEINLTVDTLKDFQRACFIVENTKNEDITTLEAIDLCLQYA